MSKDESSVESLVDDYLARKVSRRGFFQRSAALGLSASAAGGILAAAARAASKGTSGAKAAVVKRGGQLVEGYDRDFSKMDPVYSPWFDPTMVAIYEYSIVRDAKGRYVPSLFESWHVSKDNLTWTLKLRPNLKFQSGAPCNAAAVAANFNTFRNPKVGDNAIFWPSVKSVRSHGATTVIVEMHNPFTAFPEELAIESSMILNLATRKKLGTSYGASGADGTGPFKFGSYQPGTSVVVNRWADYAGSGVPYVHNKGPAHLDSVKWVPIVNTGRRADEITTGTVDVIKNPAPQDISRLKSDPNLVTVEFPALANFWIALDCSRKDLGFNDVRVRQAMSHAIDRASLAKVLYFGNATPTYGPLAPNVRWYNKAVERYNQHDPDKAKALLDAAGWKAGSGGVRTKNGHKLSWTHLCDSGQPTTSPGIDNAVVAMLAEVGFDMHVQAVDDATFNTKAFASKHSPASWSYEWLWSSPVDLLIYFHSVPSAAASGNIPAINAACAAWQRALSTRQLAKAANQLQLAWAKYVPKIPILTTHNTWVMQKKVMGYAPLQTMLYPFYNDVWLND